MSANALILESIATKRCLLATYNKTRFKLAPHILYTRHGEPYLDAIAVTRDGAPPRELKLGSFKVTGFSEYAVSEEGFEPSSLFEPQAERYEGTTLFAVATDQA